MTEAMNVRCVDCGLPWERVPESAQRLTCEVCYSRWKGVGRKAMTSAGVNKAMAVLSIRNKVGAKREEYEDFSRHMGFRTREEDLHGMWDAAVCMTEVSNYIDGLLFALDAMGEKE